jgi:hypothetical protein
MRPHPGPRFPPSEHRMRRDRFPSAPAFGSQNSGRPFQQHYGNRPASFASSPMSSRNPNTIFQRVSPRFTELPPLQSSDGNPSPRPGVVSLSPSSGKASSRLPSLAPGTASPAFSHHQASLLSSPGLSIATIVSDASQFKRRHDSEAYAPSKRVKLPSFKRISDRRTEATQVPQVIVDRRLVPDTMTPRTNNNNSRLCNNSGDDAFLSSSGLVLGMKLDRQATAIFNARRRLEALEQLKAGIVSPGTDGSSGPTHCGRHHQAPRRGRPCRNSVRRECNNTPRSRKT